MIGNIFLYYHDHDNNSHVHEQLGWIDAFCNFLSIMVKQLGGDDVKYERVSDISFAKNLPDNYFIIIISSKILLDSSEAQEFFKDVKEAVDAKKILEDKIIKVQKHFFQKDKEPEYLKHFKDHAFYKAHGIGESGTEYKDFVSSQEEKTFWMKLADLAYELFSYSEAHIGGHLDISKYKVFLAETNARSENYRNNIKRDLKSMGLGILPASSFSDKSSDFILKVDENIKESSFAIHIIGGSLGEKIQGTKHSKEEIQSKISENHANFFVKTQEGQIYKRFFWFDKVGMLQNSEVHNYYKELSHLAEEQVSTEIVVSSWEEFKSLIYQYVSFELTAPKNDKSESKAISNLIYFMYDKVDEAEALKLIKYLRKQGNSVITSNFEGDILAVRQIHLEGLKRFDTAMVFAKSANMRWVNMKVLDIMKSPGFGREKPIGSKFLLIPNTGRDQLLPTSKSFKILDSSLKPQELFRDVEY